MPTLAESIAAAKAKAGGTQTAPGTAAPAQAAPAQAAPAQAAPAQVAPLDGGNRLAGVRDALKTATVGRKRNDLPLGTGVFLLKSGKFVITEDNKYKISTFSFLCLASVVDGNGINLGSQGYSGPIPQETYEVAVFQDFSPKYCKGTMSKDLSGLQACMGWSKEKIKEYQSTDAGQDILLNLLKGMYCVDIVNSTPTNQPSIFSNQVVVQLSTKPTIAETKVNGEAVYDNAGNKVTKTYINTYWDKKVLLTELPAMIGDEAVIKAFGSQENFISAVTNEAEMLAQ